MKKLFILFICIALAFTLFACGKKIIPSVPIKDIPPATASEDEILENGNEIGTDYEALTEEERYDTERSEIARNIKDAQELILSGDFEDATMILNSLKTRKLTASEKEQVKNLQTQMISVSD